MTTRGSCAGKDGEGLLTDSTGQNNDNCCSCFRIFPLFGIITISIERGIPTNFEELQRRLLSYSEGPTPLAGPSKL